MIALVALAVAVAEPPLVRRGDAVRIEYRRGGVLVSGTGRAIASGAVGQAVPVMRDGSRRAMRGVVRGAGVIDAGGGR